MTYIIFDNAISCPLRLDRFVRDLDIITTAEPVASVQSATTFDNENEAMMFLNDLTTSKLYETSQCEIKSLEDTQKAEEEKRLQEEADRAKAAWVRTDEDTKRSILRKMLKHEGQEAVDKWLEKLGDTSGITPMTDDEYIDRKVNEIESKYGIRVTDKQRDQLFNKFVKGDS